MRASAEASERDDVPALLDAARLDPNPLVRVTAVRALGGLPSKQVVLGLRDLWPAAADSARQAIVAAWSFPGMLEAGGRRELIWVAESEQGTPAIIAGGILIRVGGGARGPGLAALKKGMQTAVSRDRALATSMAPLDSPGFREVVKQAALELDPKVRVAALARLARDPAERNDALQSLGQLAVSDRPGADWAREAMARAGDLRVTRLLMQDGKSPVPAKRRQAATSLLALGDVARAAFFLADGDVSVRTQTACEILAASARW
ncbi:MAG: hypothetical protein MUF54_24035 [Polyangiaceae bacterium]|nr:hypothetical protein [Polyangiaceae bacterium]